ncbi:gamma-glutamyltransferase [Aquirufa sp. HETE-83D]|uniref:Glutathione hydrolase proenzyme n=1 Tax=Aquirufa esocilacus TaxID=3096513 RepID=A0ABW6DGS2_9BACT
MTKYFFLLLLSFSAFTQSTKKPVIEGKQGMVVSTHPAASEIGLAILKKGGNAIDAAVAVNFALAVCHPSAGNIGGGGFLVYRDKEGNVKALDYREKAPAAASRDMYLDTEGKIIPGKSMTGIFSVGVPGTVAGMQEMHDKLGRLPWAVLLQPAVELARVGLVLTEKEARGLNRLRAEFIKENPGKNYLLSEEGKEWKVGDLLIQSDLANTLELILKKKAKGFYTGQTADFIVKEMNGQHGLITKQDLKNYQAVWRTPIKSKYKNYQIIGMPPPSSGGVALAQLLQMVAPYSLHKWGPTSDSTIQVMVEAERRVYADRSNWLGDPDFVKVPVNELIDSAYSASRMASMNFTQATKSADIQAGAFPGYESPETTHYSIVDKEGNAVSITTTLNNSYGSKVFVGGAGFLLNDEMDDFSAKAGAPNLYGLIGSKANEIQPNKRMLSSMTPTIVEEDGQLKMVVGTPGGSTIITSVFQVVLNTLEMGMNMQQAVEYPRFHHQWMPEKITAEPKRFSEEQQIRLQEKGYTFAPVSAIGLVEGILVLPNGNLQGGADSRGDDTVSAY